jgi:NAD(P)-dependent dehydrogenase (short-subunit alcohol dehydrogenase family)
MRDRLAGRSAVVTGASSGIGRALAIGLARRGMSVVACARSPAPLRDLAADGDSRLHPVVADVTDPRSIQALVDTARRLCGHVDVVINNAGIGYVEPFLGSEPAHWRDTVETNLFGALCVIQAFLPHMIESGEGLVVNVGSAAVTGWPHLALYAASKAALNAATMCLDRELTGSGVRVIAVEIGSTTGTAFGARSRAEHMATATQSWTAHGIPWTEGLASAEDSAQRIIAAIEAAT